jgi:uncharacterized repeat protein (TIGR01451 family)
MLQQAGKQMQRSWLFWVIGMLVTIVLVAKAPVQAAALYQTVPNPTPKPTHTPVPAATNTPKPKKEDNNTNQPAPTPTPTQAGPSEALTGVVTAASRLNLREGPGTNYKIVGTVANNETVQILQRNEASTWWRVCCASGTNTEGWASAQFVKPNFDGAQANQLIPVISAGEVAAAPLPAPAAAATAPTVTLALTITQLPLFAWQGQTVTLQFQVVNYGNADAKDVQLRNELPAQLTFAAADPGAGGTAEQQAGDGGQTIVSLHWPQLAAGQTVMGAIQVQIAADLADGSVVDNLAVISAVGVAPITAGISIGMPPTTLPDFQ